MDAARIRPPTGLLLLALWGATAPLATIPAARAEWQQATAQPPRVTKKPTSITLDLGSGVTLDLIVVGAGTFTMGSAVDEPGRGDDEPPHRVSLDSGFAIGRTAVTRGQWERFVAETAYRSEAETGTSGGWGWNGTALEQRPEYTWRNPGFPQDAAHPVCLVTFADAEAFCAWLSRRSGLAVSLPTEAEWEYACRAGTTTAWHDAGPGTPDVTAGDARAAPVAWHTKNAGNGTRPAAASRANAWGLHVGGNVAEWCRDWYGPYPTGPVTDPCQLDPPVGEKPRRVVRGGSWNRDPKNTRSAARFRLDPRSRNADVGFRIVLSTAVEAPDPRATGERAAPEAATAMPVRDGGSRPPSEGRATPGGAVDAKPAAAAPAPVPAPMPAPPPPGAAGGLLGWLFFLSFLAVPFIAVAALVRRLVAGGGGRGVVAPARAAGSPPAHGAAAVSVTDDGFWLRGPWPVGTTVAVSYVVDGTALEDRIVYRPALADGSGGPSPGQFIFTGVRPSDVRAVPTGDAPVTGPTVADDPTATVRGGGPRPYRAEPRSGRRPPPPRRPTAY